jgi:large subunit ribosomal protein L30e
MNWTKFNQELRNTIDTGKLIYGTNESKKECLIGEPKLLVVSSTMDHKDKELFSYYAKLLDIRLIEYPEGSIELGSVCGKPFGISVIVILNEGKSSIFEVIDEKDSDKKENVKVVAKRQKKEEKKEAKKSRERSVKATESDYSFEEIDGKRKPKKVKEEKEEVPIMEDKMFKDIIKIKKK